MTQNPIQALLWYGAALLASLSVALINGGGLSYFDTAGYLEQGQASLSSLGLDLAPDAQTLQTSSDAGVGARDDGAVVGSRSAIYSMLVAGARFTLGLSAIPVLHAVAFLLAVALPVRIWLRQIPDARHLMPRLVAVPVILAGLTSLPFYVAYLMPDIFAPILLLMAATLAAFAPRMTWPERIFAVSYGVAAATTHPSHLLIAVVLLPAVALAALIVSGRRWWIATALTGLIALGAMAERVVFTTAVKYIRNAEVVYQPFLVIRVIADGPGYRYLQDSCPDPDISTCALYDILRKSDNPLRLTASHIMFETDPDLGSYKLLDAAQQKRIADDQIGFFLDVLIARPVDTIQAFIRNTLLQAGVYNSIRQTIPNAETLDGLFRMTDLAPPSLRETRLYDTRRELAWLDPFHRLIYGVALIVIAYLCLTPYRRPPLEMRIFVLMVLAGILANALVNGGISQPSDRYGARVIFLLPLAAGLLAMTRHLTEPRT